MLISLMMNLKMFGKVVPPSTIYYQGDGKIRKRKRSKTLELFDSIYNTLYETMYGPSTETLAQPPRKSTGALPTATATNINDALRELTLLTSGYADLSIKVEKIRREVAQYEATQNLLDEDDEMVMLF